MPFMSSDFFHCSLAPHGLANPMRQRAACLAVVAALMMSALLVGPSVPVAGAEPAEPTDTASADAEKEPEKDPMEMVNLKDIDPSIIIEIKWATKDNMLGKVAYRKKTCYLRRAAAERLAKIQKGLREKGLGLKIWEGYRPLWMQQYLWDTIQDANLISNPTQGRRTHIRGIAVDVTLVDAEGKELPMPTGYCEFDRPLEMKHSYRFLPEDVLENRKTLKEAMVAGGFQLYRNEWWHYNLPNWSDFPILSEDEWAPPAPGIEVKTP